MSRHLEMLLQRERGPADTLVPRLASLYETDVRAAGWPGPESIESAADPEALQGASAPRAARPAPQAAPHAAPAPSPREPQGAPRLAVPEPVPARTNAAPIAAPVTARAGVAALAPAVPELGRTEPRRALPPEPAAREGPRIVAAEQAGRAAAPALPERARPPASVERPALRPPVPVEARLAPAMPAHSVEPRREPSGAAPAGVAARRDAPALPASAPEVRISIGRVEVRAVSAPSRPARASKLPEPMSLDQYLSRRNQPGPR